jgi:peptide/nickel transport system substrate-binding protein
LQDLTPLGSPSATALCSPDYAWFVLRRLSACLAAALAVAGCATGDDTSGDAREGGSITVGASTFPETLDPALASGQQALQALRLIYTPPLTYKHAQGREGSELVPGLARDLPEVSADGLIYDFRFRRGLHYSNGARLRASDFDRAVRRLRAMRSPLAPLYSGIASIDSDERTRRVVITLKRPDPTFPDLLALPSSAPMPRGTPSEDLTRRLPPGRGPYTVASVRPGKRLVLVRHRGFELSGTPAGRVDRITFSRVGSPSLQTRALIDDTLDVMQEPPPARLLPEIRAKYKDSYLEEATATTLALVPNPIVPPFSDTRARDAVGRALDPGELERLYGGQLRPSCNVLPEALPGYRRIEPCPYGELDEKADLIGARELIEQAGEQGAIVRLRVDPDIAPTPVTRYLVSTLRKLGLVVVLVRGGEAELELVRIAPPLLHPAGFLASFADVPDGEVRDDIAEALGEPALEETTETWAGVDQRLIEEAFAAPLGSERLPTFLSARIDAENCASFHPLFGIDLSSLCLR